MKRTPLPDAVQTHAATAGNARAALVLLCGSFPVFAVAVYARMAAAPGFSRQWFWETVRSELDPQAGLWLLAAITIGLGNALIAVGTLLLARGLPDAAARPWAPASRIAPVVALVASILYVYGYVATVRFTEPTLGDNPLFWVAYVAGFVATVGVALALLFLAVAWRRTGALRSKLLVVVSLVVAVASIALPPFVVAILAVVFAVAAMRPATSRRPDAVS